MVEEVIVVFANICIIEDGRAVGFCKTGNPRG